MSSFAGGLGRMLEDMPGATESDLFDHLIDRVADRLADRLLAHLDEHLAARGTDITSTAVRMDEAGRRLGLSEREVQRQVISGALRSVRVGRVRLIPRAALDEFLDKRAAS